MISGTCAIPAWLSTVHHDGSPRYVSNPYPRLGETVRVRLRVGAGAPVRRVFLRTCPDGEQAFMSATPGPAQPPARWWKADLPVREPAVHYRFVLEADDGVWFYSAAGPAAHDPLDSTDFRLLADAAPPGWRRSTVFYQIFPDRFANGDPSRDPRPDEYEYRGHRPRTYAWETLPPEDHVFPLVFYGGDLRGIRDRLEYLKNLGVNALYLNPVFTSFSNHKYDVADYEHVDGHLGGDEELARLRRALADRGMRYLLDVVPNHIGSSHPWFQAAQADAAAPEAGFFTFTRHPDQYATWLGVQSLPKLNYRNEELRRRGPAPRGPMGRGHELRRLHLPPLALAARLQAGRAWNEGRHRVAGAVADRRTGVGVAQPDRRAALGHRTAAVQPARQSRRAANPHRGRRQRRAAPPGRRGAVHLSGRTGPLLWRRDRHEGRAAAWTTRVHDLGREPLGRGAAGVPSRADRAAAHVAAHPGGRVPDARRRARHLRLPA